MPLAWYGRALRRCRTSCVVGVEGDLVHAQQADAARGADLLDAGVGALDVDRAGRLALQAEQDGLRGAVAVAGRAERAVQLGPYRGGVGQQALVLEAAGEHAGRAHRADRVGAGRADADREEVEDREGHGSTPKALVDDVVRRVVRDGPVGPGARGKGVGAPRSLCSVCAVPPPCVQIAGDYLRPGYSGNFSASAITRALRSSASYAGFSAARR